MEYESILIEPVLTEKSNVIREQGQYTFRVNARASKPEIMAAVSEAFNVHAVSCRVINVASKPKRLRGRAGVTATWKKAIVKVAPGETIKVFEGA
jgi:large subunit ribosomal protein L23